MALTDGLRSIELTEERIPDAMALSAEANWNQLPADWAMMIRNGRAFGVESPEGRLVATALALPFPRDFGWISMVLVTQSWRRRGLATHLLDTCVDALRARGLTPMLDATPAGRLVYSRMGFRSVFGLTRWEAGERAALPPPSHRIGIRDIEDGDRDAIAAYDAEAFGTDRRAILDDLIGREGWTGLRATGNATGDATGDERGFLLLRRGRAATQIGPVIADSEAVARALFGAAVERIAGPVFIDLPDHQRSLVELAEARGFVRQRSFDRMALGRDAPYGNPDRIFAAAGPELG